MFQPGQLAGDKAILLSIDHGAVEVVVHVELIRVAGPSERNVHTKIGVGGPEGTRNIDGQCEYVAVSGGLTRGRVEVGGILREGSASVGQRAIPGESAGRRRGSKHGLRQN